MKAIILFIVLLTVVTASANVAQPGLWNAGGMGNFSLLYPEDSLAYKKIQMVDEKISIQLYKGYAVVKGVYKMFNDTKDTVKIKTGYPLNSSYDGDAGNNKRAEIRFDSLYGLDVKINSLPALIISEPSEKGNRSSGNDNWYVWRNIFSPEDTTVITVYFIVNTNNTSIRQGYSKDHLNGFIYILETGATWKQPIIKGEIRIQLMDGISYNDIGGIKPDSVFRISNNEKGNILQYKFDNLSPSKADNIIITYSENQEGFNFDNVLTRKSSLYLSIDEFYEIDINTSGLIDKKFDSPFEIDSYDTYSILMVAAIVGIPLFFIGIFIVILIWFLRKRKRNKQRKIEQ